MINHRRSLLVQGGARSPGNFCPSCSENGVQFIEQRCGFEVQNPRKSIHMYYKEPVEGNFEDITATILDDIDSDTDEETDDKPAAHNTN